MLYTSLSQLLAQVLAFLASLRRPRKFFFYVLPFAVILGRVAPASLATAFNDIGMSLVQLIAFPAMPLVLSAVMISMANIFDVNHSSAEQRRRFSGRFFFSIILSILLASFLAYILSVYQGAGELSPNGKLAIGRFMLDNTDIHIGQNSAPVESVKDLWIGRLIPVNLLADASQEKTT